MANQNRSDGKKKPLASVGSTAGQDWRAWLGAGYTAGVNELAVIGIVAEQHRPEIWPSAFRVGPAGDDELLAVQPFGFAP